MIIYTKGQRYQELVRPGASGAMFDIVGSDQAMLFLFMPGVSHDRETISNFLSLSCFELRELYQNNIIMLTLKTKLTGWCDMVYNPFLSINISSEEIKNAGSDGALGICIVLVDSNIGSVEATHFISTTKDFKRRFFQDVNDKLCSQYSLESEQQAIQELYSLYPDAESVSKLPANTFKIGKKHKKR